MARREAREVWTSGDIVRHYGISRATLAKWRKKPEFPKPILWRRNHGGIWDSVLVRAWHHDRARARGGRRAAAVSGYRRCGNIAQVAREVGVTRDTLRKWLVELGELQPPPKRQDADAHPNPL